MLTVLTKITFTQQPNNYKDPVTNKPVTRNKTIIYNLAHDYKAKSSWTDLTDSGEITLPKNVFFKDNYGGVYSSSGVGYNIGGFTGLPPMFMRGDKVQIEWGYAYQDTTWKEIITT